MLTVPSSNLKVLVWTCQSSPIIVRCQYGFVKSRLWKSKSKLGTRLLLNFCPKVDYSALSQVNPTSTRLDLGGRPLPPSPSCQFWVENALKSTHPNYLVHLTTPNMWCPLVLLFPSCCDTIEPLIPQKVPWHRKIILISSQKSEAKPQMPGSGHWVKFGRYGSIYIH